MSNPSISVRNCGRVFILASILRQSYSVAQYRASAWIVASCTPWVASVTVSRSGHFVALMRLRKSVSSASGTLATQNGLISVACNRSCAVVIFVINVSWAASKLLNLKLWSQPIRALAAVSLSRDPLADVGRTVSELNAVCFVDRQELHRITVDQLEFSKLDGDKTSVLERGATYVQVVPCNPPTDVQYQTL